jgi:chromosome segregation ATPase
MFRFLNLFRKNKEIDGKGWFVRFLLKVDPIGVYQTKIDMLRYDYEHYVRILNKKESDKVKEEQLIRKLQDQINYQKDHKPDIIDENYVKNLEVISEELKQRKILRDELNKQISEITKIKLEKQQELGKIQSEMKLFTNKVEYMKTKSEINTQRKELLAEQKKIKKDSDFINKEINKYNEEMELEEKSDKEIMDFYKTLPEDSDKEIETDNKSLEERLEKVFE